MATLRRRGQKDVLEIAKNLDAFRRLPEKYTEPSQIGGTLSLLSRILIVFLIYKEISYYNDSNLLFTFEPDTNMDEKLWIHLDITVATPCRSIGTDIVDSTEQPITTFGKLEEEDTWFELCPEQQEYFESMQHMNNFLREEYHSVAEIIFKGIMSDDGRDLYNSLPARSNKPTRPFDACRIHGSLTLNKVAGNLHITPGKSIHFPQGHIHVRDMLHEAQNNFSHRIHRFSFGDLSKQIVQPLEGDERILDQASMKGIYNIEIVPTKIHNLLSTTTTYQYSVKHNFKPNEGVQPGIFITYDFSALNVIVKPDREPLFKFAIRLCSIISGIVVISGILNSVIQIINRTFLTFLAPEAVNYLNTHQPTFAPPPTAGYNPIPDIQPIVVTNDLLVNANRIPETNVSLTSVQ